MTRKQAEPERRQAPWWIPIVMMVGMLVGLFVSGCACILGPVVGAGTAVIGIYVTNQTKSAVTETRLGIIQEDVKSTRAEVAKLTEQMQKNENGGTEIKGKVVELERRLDKNDEGDAVISNRVKNLEVDSQAAKRGK